MVGSAEFDIAKVIECEGTEEVYWVSRFFRPTIQSKVLRASKNFGTFRSLVAIQGKL